MPSDVPTPTAAPAGDAARFQGRLRIAGGLLLRPFQPILRAALLWNEADGLRMSAAMSFYGVLSFAPLLVLMVALLGWWVDRSYLETNLIAQMQDVVGERGAELVRQALTSAQQPSDGMVASLIAFGLLLFGATGVFAELQSAFERLWLYGRTPSAPTKWWHTASLRLRGMAYILAFGFLLLVSLVVTTMLNMVAGWASDWRLLAPVLRLVNEVVSFALCTALFTGLMRLSGGPKPRLRFLIVGAAIGATLFTLGKHVLAYYLSTAAVVSAYGAAGSLVVLLMWIYFSSAILLFSAGSARALADQTLQPVDPESEKPPE
ncbi:YihY/virulence factor BrkB family protein [uncultured Xylophilus sp.]|uniref:YihY/virulence factor BrkB family protein n=1 Tax=uncultured Xylophilus sp. TaxID=296832 RepID=UPI0025F52679|nr:YihY/virulence factor BrkB family protein [uncultured Xylophilus sp.]